MYDNKICIGLPHVGMFGWQTTMALLSLKIPSEYSLVYHLVGSCLIYDAREKIVKFARDNNCKYTVMLDSDMVPPSDMLIKMVNTLDDGKLDLVTGMAFKRTAPFQPCFYTKCDYDLDAQKPYLESPVEFPDKGFIPLAGVGLACCMMRTEIFDCIDQKKKDKSYFFPLPNLGEDLTFCLIARKCGIKMAVDLSIDVGHVSNMAITKDHFIACYEEHKKINSSQAMFTGGEG